MDDTKVVSISRAERKRQEKGLQKQEKDVKKYLNDYPSRKELLEVQKQLENFGKVQNAIMEALVSKGLISKEDLNAAFREVMQFETNMKRIAQEPDWFNRFKLCEELKVDNSFLIEHLKANPQEVSPEIMKDLKELYFPKEEMDPLKSIFSVEEPEEA
jgi:hypothetical protein